MVVFDLVLSDAWKKQHPRAAMGVLVVAGIVNIRVSDALEAEKTALEQ